MEQRNQLSLVRYLAGPIRFLPDRLPLRLRRQRLVPRCRRRLQPATERDVLHARIIVEYCRRLPGLWCQSVSAGQAMFGACRPYVTRNCNNYVFI